jgi:hypothetical protein
MSKPKVLSILDKKIIASDNESRKIEKEFLKGNVDKKNFVDDYLSKRMQFH